MQADEGLPIRQAGHAIGQFGQDPGGGDELAVEVFEEGFGLFVGGVRRIEEGKVKGNRSPTGNRD